MSISAAREWVPADRGVGAQGACGRGGTRDPRPCEGGDRGLGVGCRRVVDPLEAVTRLRLPHLEDGRELRRWVRERNCEWMERWEWAWLRFPPDG